MNETEIRRYGELMRELGLTGLEITDDKNKVRLERMGAAPKEQTYAVAGKEAGDTETSREAGGAAKDCVSVTSPIVGIFYAAPGGGRRDRRGVRRRRTGSGIRDGAVPHQEAGR